MASPFCGNGVLCLECPHVRVLAIVGDITAPQICHCTLPGANLCQVDSRRSHEVDYISKIFKCRFVCKLFKLESVPEKALCTYLGRSMLIHCTREEGSFRC
jgi:hypothetical protein